MTTAFRCLRLLLGITALSGSSPALAAANEHAFLRLGGQVAPPHGFVEMCQRERQFCSATRATGDQAIETAALAPKAQLAAVPDIVAPPPPAMLRISLPPLLSPPLLARALSAMAEPEGTPFLFATALPSLPTLADIQRRSFPLVVPVPTGSLGSIQPAFAMNLPPAEPVPLLSVTADPPVPASPASFLTMGCGCSKK